jgi:hypothetical protein
MSALINHLERIGLSQLLLCDKLTKQLEQFDLTHLPLYQHAINTFPEKDPNGLLMGLLTKTTLTAITQVESNLDSLQAMHKVFSQSLEPEYATKFESNDLIQLKLNATLWFLVMGYNQMEFGFCHEHATRVGSLVANVEETTKQETIEILMKSYYLGKENRPSWFSRLFSKPS